VVHFKDVIRNQNQFSGREREKINELFAPVERMNERLARDESRFLTAMLEAVQPFLAVTSIDQLRNMPHEPIGFAAKYYQSDLSLDRVLAELDVPAGDLPLLRMLIERDAAVNAALAPLLEAGGAIEREKLESRTGGVSGFQTISDKLGIGIPFNATVR
jgi:hypothetical protein